MSYKNFNCLECGEEFGESKKLHMHLRSHKIIMGNYYVKHYPRKSLFDGELIPFKTLEQYMGSYFFDDAERDKWLESASTERVQAFLLKTFKDAFNKNNNEALTYNDIASSRLPSVESCIKTFSSYGSMCKQLGVKVTLAKRIPSDFWTADLSKMTIMIDTREQTPFVYRNSISSKIDIGDYTAMGDDYDYTYVDRKAKGDFISTLSKANFERFKKEMQRVRDLESQIYVVVEAPIKEIKERKSFNRKQASVEHIFHNMREIQREFSDVCQFVFADNVEHAREITARILKCGKNIWGVDLQYFINNR
tara:strand:- start:13356 stop:14276 length:921 start_codon:yes stop_codon:yes gene_type:complete